MPGRTTHHHFHFDTLASKVKARELDDDARSDWTIDHHDHLFGAPLERFHDADDYETKTFDVSEPHIELLRTVQDREWVQSQRETKEAFGSEPGLSLFEDPQGNLEVRSSLL